MNNRYEDLLYLPHPTSRRHPRMSMQERAAQFSPFAALRGYGAAIRRAGQPVTERIAICGNFQRIDEYQRLLMLTDRTAIPLDEILSIEGAVFDGDAASADPLPGERD